MDMINDWAITLPTTIEDTVSKSLGEVIDWFRWMAGMVHPSSDLIDNWYQASLAPVLPGSLDARIELRGV